MMRPVPSKQTPSPQEDRLLSAHEKIPRGKTAWKNRYGFDSERKFYAAIDLGSNTCRLLIAVPEEEGNYKVVDSFSRIIRLGSGVKETKNLSEEGIERALAALRECSKKLKRYPTSTVRAVATEACRLAENREILLTRARDELGIKIDVITEREEAQLALLGCTALLKPQIPYALVFDIGGCSTEVLWTRMHPEAPQKTAEIIDWLSLPFGVVNVVEACGGDAGMFYPDIRARIAKQVQSLSQTHNILDQIRAGNVQMIGSSGTTTTVAALSLGLRYYDRTKVDGSYLLLTSLREIGKHLLEMKPRERANHSCIGPGRSDLVLAGVGILEGICDAWPVETIRVADRGVRDGILVQLHTEEKTSEEDSQPIIALARG